MTKITQQNSTTNVKFQHQAEDDKCNLLVGEFEKVTRLVSKLAITYAFKHYKGPSLNENPIFMHKQIGMRRPVFSYYNV